MAILKIGNDKIVNIETAIETLEFVAQSGFRSLRIEFGGSEPLGPDSIEILAEMFKEIPFIQINIEDGESCMYDGEISLYRITRELRGKRFIVVVHLTLS